MEDTLPEIEKFKIGFRNGVEAVERQPYGDVFERFYLDFSDLQDSIEYSISLKVVNEKTTMLEKEYSIYLSQSTLSKASGPQGVDLIFGVTRDSLPDRRRHVVVAIEVQAYGKSVSDRNEAVYQTLQITVNPLHSLFDYRYLAYIGTNFDLVDGIETNKLFFATNIFIPNSSHRLFKGGLYFSLYGNRPFSSIDTTIEQITTDVRQINDSVQNRFVQTVDRTTFYSSDNLGAQVSFLWNLGGLSKPSKDFQIWLSPTFEFIFRRATSTVSFTNPKFLDTLTVESTAGPGEVVTNKTSVNTYQYEYNYGLGFFINHSNENISIRFHSTVGRSQPYYRESSNTLQNLAPFERQDTDWFYSGKLWITEPSSGLTIQGEVFNRSNRPTPYYVVTLSKAIDLKNLGKILQPLTSRD